MLSGLKPLGRERLWVLLLLAPTLLGLIFGAFGSVLATVGLSLFKWDLLTPPVYVGLDNFKALVNDDLFLDSLSNTVKFSFTYVPLVIVLSLAVALLMNRKIRGVSFFRVVFFLPVISSAVSVGLVWLWIYSRDTGLLNYIIVALGGEPVRWLSKQNALFSVIIVNVWGAIGEGMIIFLAGLQAIPRELYEAAQVDGATEWPIFRRITLPLITPSIFFQTIISTINAFQVFEFIYVLTRQGANSSSTPTLVYSIYRNGFNYFRMGDASAQAIVLAAIIFILTLIYFQLQRRLVFYD
ncbi:MAG: ABC transporter permease subunit [Anaerolineaceae bacterium]|nr:ABC transporter permease subunit [Anaerolineaceae bacterium]